jgi:hypothetical protein
VAGAVEVDGEADQVDRSVVGEEAVDGEGVHRQAGASSMRAPLTPSTTSGSSSKASAKRCMIEGSSIARKSPREGVPVAVRSAGSWASGWSKNPAVTPDLAAGHRWVGSRRSRSLRSWRPWARAHSTSAGSAVARSVMVRSARSASRSARESFSSSSTGMNHGTALTLGAGTVRRADRLVSSPGGCAGQKSGGAVRDFGAWRGLGGCGCTLAAAGPDRVQP